MDRSLVRMFHFTSKRTIRIAKPGDGSICIWRIFTCLRRHYDSRLAFTFTVTVSAVSLINLGYFKLERKATWLWFLVYLASAAASGLFLWRARARPSAKGLNLSPAWRAYMLVETAILGLYGVGTLLF